MKAPMSMMVTETHIETDTKDTNRYTYTDIETDKEIYRDSNSNTHGVKDIVIVTITYKWHEVTVRLEVKVIIYGLHDSYLCVSL